MLLPDPRDRRFTGADRVAFSDEEIPYQPLRVYGNAERPVERVGMVGPGLYSRIAPRVSWSWNLAGERWV